MAMLYSDADIFCEKNEVSIQVGESDQHTTVKVGNDLLQPCQLFMIFIILFRGVITGGSYYILMRTFSVKKRSKHTTVEVQVMIYLLHRNFLETCISSVIFTSGFKHQDDRS